MDDFLVRALFAGFGVAAVAGPLGSFVVWRRMSYFGDTLAHSALLGVSLGFLLGIDLTIGVFVVCLVVASLLIGIQKRVQLSSDAILGILAHGTLALGLLAVSFMKHIRVDLMAFLFGDILAVDVLDLIWIYAGGTVVLLIVAALWRSLISSTVHEDLARAEGVPVDRMNMLLTLCIALVVATAMKVVGILLVAALLIIPASSARLLSRTPEQMAILASLIGGLSVAGGLYLSFMLDTPAGPSIIVGALILFGALTFFRAILSWTR